MWQNSSSSSSVPAGCEGTVPIRPDLPPPKPSREGLFWHQICGPRQTASEYFSLRLCAASLAFSIIHFNHSMFENKRNEDKETLFF